MRAPGTTLIALPAVTMLLAFATGPAQATDMFGKDFESCANKTSTLEIVDCTAARTKIWDTRLNAAYAALLPIVEPEQRDKLVAAQRLWIQYRDANCGFYAAARGTVRQIQSAECLRAMTQDRALELEQAAKP